MKRVLLIVILLLTTPAYAAMSDAAALSKARQLWGDSARIGTVRGILDSNWTKQVGVNTTGCRHDFTVLGSGFNTWEAAFASWDSYADIEGPHATSKLLHSDSWDNVGVLGLQWIVDGSPFGPEVIPSEPSPYLGVSTPLDVVNLPNGIHTYCAVARDAAGNRTATAAKLFRVQH